MKNLAKATRRETTVTSESWRTEMNVENHPKDDADSRDAVENFSRKTSNIEEPATWSTNLARLEVFLKSGH